MEASEEVTVFRSAEASAADEAAEVSEVLARAGLRPSVLDDSAPGVPPGAIEVRVPASHEAQAEAALAAAASAPAEPVDNSAGMDLVDVFRVMGTSAEMEALSIRSVLEASGIPCVMVGAPVYPNLPFAVQVPRMREQDARRVISEARSAGPEAAEEAEKATEG